MCWGGGGGGGVPFPRNIKILDKGIFEKLHVGYKAFFSEGYIRKKEETFVDNSLGEINFVLKI